MEGGTKSYDILEFRSPHRTVSVTFFFLNPYGPTWARLYQAVTTAIVLKELVTLFRGA
jgi:hypothetical protein